MVLLRPDVHGSIGLNVKKKPANTRLSSRERLIARLGRLMILADDYDTRLHWWYRVQFHSQKRMR